MTRISVDPSLWGGLTQRVELCDPSGQVLGHFLPEAEYQRLLYASVELPFSEEEMARREAEIGGCTLEEIWKQLGQK